MSWDEALADRYADWSAHMTEDIPAHAQDPDSREYVFVARKENA
ncbi:hypothetical protein [Actinophytocola sp. KF-1]